jgi:hypothetical protein
MTSAAIDTARSNPRYSMLYSPSVGRSVGCLVTELALLGEALRRCDEQRAEQRDDQEPVRHGHLGRVGAAEEAQDESGREDHQVEHRDRLQQHRVGGREDRIAGDDQRQLGVVGQCDADAGDEQQRSGAEGDGDGDDAGGDRATALGRVLRSESTSRTSFSRYVAEETRQNAAKPMSVSRTRYGSSSTPAAAGATKTRTFLAHCLGRQARSRPTAIDVAPRSDPAEVLVV